MDDTVEKRTALFFPYLQVPQTAWFTKVLLYWDRAATIVPTSLWDNHEELDPFMRDLVEAELLDLLLPDEGLGAVRLGQYIDGFLTLLGDHTVSTPELVFTRLHIGKISEMLLWQLHERGLARCGKSEEWWDVEEYTANLYMAYLASTLSAASPGTYPVTNSEKALAAMAQNRMPHSGGFEQKLDALRYTVIKEVLPAPQGSVAVGQLVQFKTENSELLRECRIHLDGELAALARIDDPRDLAVSSAAAMQKIERQITSLKNQMEKRRWPKVVLCGFGGVAAAALATAAPLADASNPLSFGLAVASGAAGLGPAGYTLAELAMTPRFDPQEPLAYAVLGSQLGKDRECRGTAWKWRRPN